jgi:TrmH family RNA methyltransferase
MLSKAQIKYIHSLRHKKYRLKSGSFLAEGIKVTDELLTEKYIPVVEIFALASWFDAHGRLAETHPDVALTPVTARELRELSALDTPAEVVTLCKLPPTETTGISSGKVSLMLESIRDPGNLGTIIRIADFFAIEQVICSPDCADAFNSKTVQATMGSIARVKVTEAVLEAVTGEHTTLPVYAASLHGKDITAFSPITEGILLIGNESKGLSEKMLRLATHQITIPRLGRAESLNAAVATGIICGRLLLV